MKKINPYRAGTGFSLALILIVVLIKAWIWSEAELNYKPHPFYTIYLGKEHHARYVIEKKQKIYNWSNNLIPPAFTIVFVLLAVRLIKMPGILEEKDG